MSFPSATIVLDNTVISSFELAGALARVLALWPGRWVVTLQVRAEAAGWAGYGARVVALLDQLQARNEIAYASPEPGAEGPLFAELQRTRGAGESASIAIAYVRGFVVATDDRRAIRSCQSLNPPVPTVSTEGLLDEAVADHLLERQEPEAIWARTEITDPRRGIGR